MTQMTVIKRSLLYPVIFGEQDRIGMYFLGFLQPFVSLVSVLCRNKFNALQFHRENAVKISVCVSVLVAMVVYGRL